MSLSLIAHHHLPNDFEMNVLARRLANIYVPLTTANHGSYPMVLPNKFPNFRLLRLLEAAVVRGLAGSNQKRRNMP